MKSGFLLLFAVLLSTKLIVTDAACMTIAEAKALPDGTSVTLTGKIATTCYGEIPLQVYIEEPDRSAGIMVATGSTGSLPWFVDGKIVNVSGKINTHPKELVRAISNATIAEVGTQYPLLPLGMSTSSIGGSSLGLQQGVSGHAGLSNFGLLIKTWGWVALADPKGEYVEVDDGSGLPIQVQVTRLTRKPRHGEFVVVTGVVSGKSDGGSGVTAIIRPRRESDIVYRTPSLEELIAAPVPPGKLGIYWLGQAGFLLQDHEGRKVNIDPYLSDYCRIMVGGEWVRMVPVPIPPENLQPGLTLITHDHADHCDPWTLQPIYLSSQSFFIGPTSVYNHMGAPDIGIPANRRSVLNTGQTTTWNGIQITAVYANHTPDSVGFVVNMAGRKVYISGDTLFDQALVDSVSAQSPDIMLVSMNGKYDNLSATEAASLVKACGPQVAIPMHYGMFAINTADPQTFADACLSQGVTAEIIILGHGCRVIL